ncbi:hypothetical protein HPB52_023293 [Rhipicephalus sanguineus]|uniref:Uncharacterized protein n=1 Tax=Rhipicephalus sanguineus TaxID=34632 RepID=A0A9D4TBW5_RHISA|nr:hypothetical protein HPB52_023293 [Rhipicephalus sanguineus]
MLLAMESGKTYSIDMLCAIHLLAYSWQQVEPPTVQNCFAPAQFVVPAQPTSPSEADATEEDIDNSECEARIAEVLGRQGGGDKVPFATFSDVDKEVETCEVAEAARALDVMRVFAEKNGLMDKLAFHLDGFEAAVVAVRPPKQQTRVTNFWRPIFIE